MQKAGMDCHPRQCHACQCPTLFAQPHTAMCMLLPSPVSLNMHWINIMTAFSLCLLTLGSSPTACGEWRMCSWVGAAALGSSGISPEPCWPCLCPAEQQMLPESLPAASGWPVTNWDISLFPGAAPPGRWRSLCAGAAAPGVPCLSGWKQPDSAKPQIHAVWHPLLLRSRSSIQHLLLCTSWAAAAARTGTGAGPPAPL